jgi:hypothetical protein
LLDSNIVVAAEPYAGAIEPNMRPAAELMRRAGELGHVLCVAPATRDDVLENIDPVRRRQRLAELQKFSQLEEVPLTRAIRTRAGDSTVGSNDHRDLRLLATLDSGAVNYLVSEDRALHRRAARAGLAHVTLRLREAVELLNGFIIAPTQTPPKVDRCAAYALDPEQPIFDSLRADYAGFDDWLAKVRRDAERRTCFIITDDSAYAAIALLKAEDDCEYDLPKPVTKITTLKVGADYGQVKYGELLLKAIFAEAHNRRTATLYVEVFEKHAALVAFLLKFGFADSGARTARDELVLVKCCQPQVATESELGDLEYHIRYGPPALLVRQRAYFVPIWPEWHDQLFPEMTTVSDQMTLFEVASKPATHPWGNALRKAYLCNSPTKTMDAGDVLLFYRSGGAKTISAVGIVEDTLRSNDPSELAQFVGLRTVYTLDEISVMCRSVRGVLAIAFRQDRFVNPELTLEELQIAGVLKAHPQSITRVPEGSMEWLRKILTESR